MPRSVAHWLTLAALIGSACAPRAARFETSDPVARDVERRPPAVAVDPVLPLPPAKAQAPTQSGLVALTPPVAAERVERVISAFFRAMLAESPEALDAVLAEGSYLETAGGRQSARGALRARLGQLDYEKLRGVRVYRERDLQIYSGEEREAFFEARGLPTDIARDHVFVRVALLVSHAGKVRLFADEMSFTLRRDRDRLRIALVRESSPSP